MLEAMMNPTTAETITPPPTISATASVVVML
jgi:hypothetical protein